MVTVPEAATTAGSSALPETGHRVVQRTLMRADEDLDVRSLYMWAVTTLSGGESDVDGDDEGRYVDPDVGLQGYGRVNDDHETVVDPGRRITFGAYFNAFPAGYWRRWTDYTHVRLEATLRGEGTFIVYRSTSKGHVLRHSATPVDTLGEGADGTGVQTISLDLPLQPFIDGGWYWFDIEGGEHELTLAGASWAIETDRLTSGTVSLGITTFNRPDFCTDQLLNIASDPELLEIVDHVIVVDQGNQTVADHPQYAAAAEALGDKLRVITQPNLGGSGGFSRAMHETVEAGLSDYVLLLDDDVVCQLDGIRRAIAFADLAKTPTLVGGHMFSLYDRTVMHAYGETVGRWRWFWGPAPATTHGHDFSQIPMRSAKWIHRRIDVDFNGWWMCLIPTQVVKEIGLSLPMFIKWDDCEFGLRAGAAGFPTVSFPGAAVWHVPWTEKDDTLDWQAYFHERNRLVSALLHSPYDHGGRLVLESMENHVKRLISMQYSTGEIIMMALQDVLDGPERMHRDLRSRLGEIRELRAGFDDARPRTDLDLFPAPKLKKPHKRGKGVGIPTSRSGKIMMAATGLVRQVTKPRDLAAEHPEGIIPHVDQRWYRLAHFDSAIVSAADGSTAAWHRRDRKAFTAQMSKSSAMHARLYREWPKLSARYREALPAPDLARGVARVLPRRRVTAVATPPGAPHDLSKEPMRSPAPSSGLLEVFRRRYLLKLLVQREIKARYQGSLLGLLWSYLNPLSQFFIYFFIIGVIFNLHDDIPNFAIHIFSAIIIVHFFSETFNAGTRSIVRNRQIVKKMAVPREMFPVASMLVSLYHVGPQIVILIAATVFYGWTPDVYGIVCFAVGLVLIMLLGTGLALLFSAANVFFRDVSSVVNIVTNLVRFGVPMIYSYEMVSKRFGAAEPYYLLNPIADAVLLFQRAFWTGSTDQPTLMPDHLLLRGLVMVAVSAVVLLIGQVVFTRLENKIPERL